ncbi:MAG: hypothetical protein WCK27_27090, partial [Verrucomicrobiota bacterium]
KTEGRNPKEGRNPNSENGLSRLAAAPPGWLSIRTSAFGFLSAFGLRISGLEWPVPTLEQPWIMTLRSPSDPSAPSDPP